jgi:hypothetical protein
VTVQLALLEGQLVTSTAPVPSPMVSGSHQSAPSDAELSGLIGRCVMKERKINAAASFELSLRLSRACLGKPSYCSSGGNRRGKRHRLSSYLRDRQPATAAAAACRDSQDGVASAVGPRPTHPGGQASTPLTTSCCAVTRRAQRTPEILLQRERNETQQLCFCQRFVSVSACLSRALSWRPIVCVFKRANVASEKRRVFDSRGRQAGSHRGHCGVSVLGEVKVSASLERSRLQTLHVVVNHRERRRALIPERKIENKRPLFINQLFLSLSAACLGKFSCFRVKV